MNSILNIIGIAAYAIICYIIMGVLLVMTERKDAKIFHRIIRALLLIFAPITTPFWFIRMIIKH